MILYLLFIHEKYLYLFIFISSKGCFLQCCAFFTVWNICQNWPIFKFRCKKSTLNMNKGRGENKLCSDYFGTISVLHFWKKNSNTHTKKRFLECMIALVCVLQRVFPFHFFKPRNCKLWYFSRWGTTRWNNRLPQLNGEKKAGRPESKVGMSCRFN